jgi:hypothetical protein
MGVSHSLIAYLIAFKGNAKRPELTMGRVRKTSRTLPIIQAFSPHGEMTFQTTCPLIAFRLVTTSQLPQSRE